MYEHELFIEKIDSGLARLEHRNGDEVGTYIDWKAAVNDALRMFDRWKGEPTEESTDEAAAEAEMTLMIQEVLDKMLPLIPDLERAATQIPYQELREKMTEEEWQTVNQAVKLTRAMLRHHETQKRRLSRRAGATG